MYNNYAQGNMNGYNYGYNNYLNNYNKQEVVRVNGENGAKAFNLPPNSSIILLDETAPMIWLKMTDGAGYATLAPYDITPHMTEQQVNQLNTKNLENRISKLEELVNGLYESNAQSIESSASANGKRVIIKEQS